MIVVTVELLSAVTGARTHLGTAVIANDGRGTVTSGNYDVRLSKRGRPADIWRRGRVEGFPRKRLGAWDLLYRALRATVGGRNA